MQKWLKNSVEVKENLSECLMAQRNLKRRIERIVNKRKKGDGDDDGLRNIACQI